MQRPLTPVGLLVLASFGSLGYSPRVGEPDKEAAVVGIRHRRRRPLSAREDAGNPRQHGRDGQAAAPGKIGGEDALEGVADALAVFSADALILACMRPTNGFRDLKHFAQPCALTPAARHNARQFASEGF
jgi:hypothetical protein